MNRTSRAWLESELPGLVESGVVPDDVAVRIRAHYDYEGPTRQLPLMLMIWGTLGAVSIGLGIILLFAHNWDEFSRPVRTVLSFSPLILGQVLLGYAILKRAGSAAWAESTAAFTVLALGACIALISQTYQIPGDLGPFLLVWSLLGLPIVYLADSRFAGFLYLAAIVWWAGYASGEGDHAAWYWLLLLLIMPYLIGAYRGGHGPSRLALLSWGVALTTPFGVNMAVEHELSGLWMPLLSLLFAAMYLVGASVPRVEWARWKRAYAWMGAVGTVGILLAATFSESWRRVANNGFFAGDSFDGFEFVLDAVPMLGFVALVSWMTIRRMPKMTLAIAAIAGAPVAVVLAYCIAGLIGDEFVSIVIASIYVVILGIGFIVQGVRTGHIGQTNVGLITVGIWISLRFFDADFSIVWRGVLFIVLGIAFLGVNVFLIRRTRDEVTT